jgi:protein ImuA
VASAELEFLKREVARLERGSSASVSARFSTGADGLDEALGGGLMRGAMHEVFAGSILDEASAAAFVVGLALRASPAAPIVWVRQDFVGLELGEIYAPGLAELGLSPERLILVKARDGPGVLRAGEEAARCPPLGAVIIEPWGNPKALDLVASRRLMLAAARSGVPVFMLRAGGAPLPSAAATRWSVRAAASAPLEAQAPGHPVFEVELMRDRAGAMGRNWIVEWKRDVRSFSDIAGEGAAALSGGVVPIPAGGPHPEGELHRRAG